MRYALAVIVLTLVVGGCSEGPLRPSLDTGYAKQRAMAEIAIASVTADSAPDAGPSVGDKCPACNDPPGACGVGKVGDGRTCTPCQTCGADGRIDERDLSGSGIASSAGPAEPLGLVVYITPGTKSGWAMEWYNAQADAFRDRGWSVSLLLVDAAALQAGGESIPEEMPAIVATWPDGTVRTFYSPIEPKDTEIVK